MGPKYFALSFASLTESFYAAIREEPDNQMLLLTVSKGLEARVLHYKTPHLIGKYLINLHNRFHLGSSTSFVELVQLVPDVIWQHYCA